ncbi:MAG TPA: hypothetical protein VH917_01725 [Ignavibacteriaceae bacterium]
MIYNAKIFSQSSFGLSGLWGLTSGINIPYYNYESNPSNFSSIRDWGISLTYGSEFSESVNSDLYSLSLSKTLGSHNLSGRISPGYQKQFLFSTGETIIINDTTTQSLTADYTYEELFGIGYSYKFTPQLSAGFSFRFFNQDFNQEVVTPVFGDTLYLVRENLNEQLEYWKGDLGINFILDNNLNFSAASVNLLNITEKAENDEFAGYELKQETAALLSGSYTPFEFANLNISYETSGSFQASITGRVNEFIYGITGFHDKHQSPFIAGIIPAIGYKAKLFEVMLSGVKYFSDRTEGQSLSEFQDEGIHNVINNSFSYDKILLSVSFNIDGSKEQKVKLINVEVVKDIYPTFTEAYVDNPVAYGTAVNLTSENFTIKPSIKIKDVHEAEIQSPEIQIAPFDTIRIPFYTIIPGNYSSGKTVLSYADFYISVSSEEPDDQLQKAILVNGVNAWDGKVINLRYFIKRDFEFSMAYSKKILSDNKSMLDTIPAMLLPFYKAKLLFDDFVKRIVYTSDPRASAEYVQFPKQTIELKGGDCDDLSVCYSSMLESVGIESALVDYQSNGKIRHVHTLFNTTLTPEQASFITSNDTKYFLRKNTTGQDEIWIPVETTSLTDFETAWRIGVEKFNKEAINDLGIATEKVQIIDVNY